MQLVLMKLEAVALSFLEQTSANLSVDDAEFTSDPWKPHASSFDAATIYERRWDHRRKTALIFSQLCNHEWSTPRVNSEGVGSLIDSGLDNLFCLSVNRGVDSVLLYQQALKAACLVFLENKWALYRDWSALSA